MPVNARSESPYSTPTVNNKQGQQNLILSPLFVVVIIFLLMDRIDPVTLDKDLHSLFKLKLSEFGTDLVFLNP